MYMSEFTSLQYDGRFEFEQPDQIEYSELFISKVGQSQVGLYPETSPERTAEETYLNIRYRIVAAQNFENDSWEDDFSAIKAACTRILGRNNTKVYKDFSRKQESSSNTTAEVNLNIWEDFDVAVFTQESQRRQLGAGVDPALCMQLGEIGLTKRNPLEEYFGALKMRKYLLPTDPVWRAHDIIAHVKTIRNLHPDLVDLLSEAGEFGENLLMHGMITEAERLGDIIDVLLASEFLGQLEWDKYMPSSWYRVYIPLVMTAIKPNQSEVQIQINSDVLIATQEKHVTRMNQALYSTYQKNFSPLLSA